MVDQRERLLAPGKLSAGPTHELNNPAAAAGRAAHDLRDRVTHIRHKPAMIADGSLDRAQLRQLVLAQEEFVEKARNAPDLSPRERAPRPTRYRRTEPEARRCAPAQVV